LLSRLARSTSWRLEVAALGNEAFAEKALLEAPRWDGVAAGVEAVVVCSDEQLTWARHNLPGVRIVWAAHCSLPGIVTPAALADGLDVVTFTRRNQRAVVAQRPSLRVFTLTPAYHPVSRWKWKERTCWTACSRPSERRRDWGAGMKAALTSARSGIGAFNHTLYGQDQPGGFLSGEKRKTVEEASSCYVGRAMDNSGMGLVEHECWEMGSPVVARWAGDLYDGLPQERMNADLSACLIDGPTAMIHAERGMQYLLDHHSQRQMDESVAWLLG